MSSPTGNQPTNDSEAEEPNTDWKAYCEDCQQLFIRAQDADSEAAWHILSDLGIGSYTLPNTILHEASCRMCAWLKEVAWLEEDSEERTQYDDGTLSPRVRGLQGFSEGRQWFLTNITVWSILLTGQCIVENFHLRRHFPLCDVNSAETYDVIKKWILECHDEHARCDTLDSLPVLPTRVVHVGGEDDVMINVYLPLQEREVIIQP